MHHALFLTQQALSARLANDKVCPWRHPSSAIAKEWISHAMRCKLLFQSIFVVQKAVDSNGTLNQDQRIP